MSQNCATIHQRYIGKVLCLEQLVYWIIEAKGFEHIMNKIVPLRHCDNALRSAFGSGMLAQEENVTLTLQSYIDDLQVSSRGLLCTSIEAIRS